MLANDLQSLLLGQGRELSELRRDVAALLGKEQRVQAALALLGRRTTACLDAFHRDTYKSTDQRLVIRAVADEIRVFDRLGYDVSVTGARFLVGVAELLDGRNQAALDQFSRFIEVADPHDRILAAAHYLSAMVCYNRRDFTRGVEHFQTASRLTSVEHKDWQSLIYVGELQHFLRSPREMVEKTFADVEEDCCGLDDRADIGVDRATLYLKWGNCYFGTFDPWPRRHRYRCSPPLHGSPFGFDVLVGAGLSSAGGSVVFSSTVGGVLAGALAAGFLAHAAHPRTNSRPRILIAPIVLDVLRAWARRGIIQHHCSSSSPSDTVSGGVDPAATQLAETGPQRYLIQAASEVLVISSSHDSNRPLCGVASSAG